MVVYWVDVMVGNSVDKWVFSKVESLAGMMVDQMAAMLVVLLEKGKVVN